MLKIAATFCAGLIAASALSTSVEARSGGFAGGARMGGFSGARMGGFAGPRFGAANFAGARMGFAGPGRMGFAGPGRMGIVGPGRMGIAGPGRVWAGRGAWAGSGAWAGRRWAGGRWAGWRGGRWWPWWGVGAGVALAATWPYYGGYGYDDCVQWRPDWGWVNVCSGPYGGYW